MRAAKDEQFAWPPPAPTRPYSGGTSTSALALVVGGAVGDSVGGKEGGGSLSLAEDRLSKRQAGKGSVQPGELFMCMCCYLNGHLANDVFAVD